MWGTHSEVICLPGPASNVTIAFAPQTFHPILIRGCNIALIS
jgi:hypothetical protein